MSHLVAWYPDLPLSMQTAAALVDGGSSYLEVQFPFSDPTADGPAIQHACARALRAGFTPHKGFSFIDQIKSPVPVFVMCYANTVFFNGVRRFVEKCADHGVHGLIVPDLPVDRDEGLYEAGEEYEVSIVPVVSPAVSDQRLQLILKHARPYLYTALRPGITGAETLIDDSSRKFLGRVRQKNGGGRYSGGNPPAAQSQDTPSPSGEYPPLMLAGFGIDRHEQVAALAPLVHAVIAGSAFVRAVSAAAPEGPQAVYRAVRAKAEELLGTPQAT
jgi:tryptophan synthase alpha chain